MPVYFQDEHKKEETERANLTVSGEIAEAQDQGEIVQNEELLGLQSIIGSNMVPNASPQSGDEVEVQRSAADGLAAEVSYAGESTTEIKKHETVEGKKGSITSPISESPNASPGRFAYAQLLSNPSQICSALLFFKVQRDSGDAAISRVILYPSSWEEETSSDAFTSALALMRLVQDEYKITYHPVKVKDLSEERTTEREMVAHLAKNNWEYDRLMYLRSPGLILNIAALDSALQASQSRSVLSRSWAQANPEPSTGPSIVLVSEKGIHTPRGSNRRLIAEAFTSHANHHENEMDVEAAAQTAAYVHFEEGELEHRRTEKEWYGGVFERYERGRAEICKGISFEDERTELKKVRRRRWK